MSFNVDGPYTRFNNRMEEDTCIKCGHAFKTNQGIDWNDFGFFHRNKNICKPKRCFFPRFRNIDCYINDDDLFDKHVFTFINKYKREMNTNKILKFREEIRERRQLRFTFINKYKREMNTNKILKFREEIRERRQLRFFENRKY